MACRGIRFSSVWVLILLGCCSVVLLLVGPMKLRNAVLENEVSEVKRRLDAMKALVDGHERELLEERSKFSSLLQQCTQRPETTRDVNAEVAKRKDASDLVKGANVPPVVRHVDERNQRRIALFVPKADPGTFAPGARNRITFDFEPGRSLFPFCFCGNYTTSTACDMQAAEASESEAACAVRWELYKRLHDVNNPVVCPQSWKNNATFCSIGHNTGLGHHLHFFGHCLTKALLDQKPVVLSEYWGYAVGCEQEHKWACFMEPVLKCRQRDMVGVPPQPQHQTGDNILANGSLYDHWTLTNALAYWKGDDALMHLAKKAHPKPELLIKSLMMRWLFRPNEEVQSFFWDQLKNFEEVCSRPYAAIHIRRTDKVYVGAEAQLHHVWEYMEMVDHFFDNLKEAPRDSRKRCLFVATDDDAAVQELSRDYGSRYSIVNFAGATRTAKGRRGNPIGVRGEGTMFVLLDVALLANADFMVGTFSSQISRLAYELKTSIVPLNGYLRAVKVAKLLPERRVFKGRDRYFQIDPALNDSVPIVGASLDDWWYYGT